MYRMIASQEDPSLLGLPLLLVALCGSPFAAAGAETLTLSIGDAVRMAVEKNLNLQVATYSPAIAETGIRKARAIYDPLLSALVDHQESNLQAAPQSFFVARQRDFHFDASISQLVPSGATTSLSFNNLWSKDNLGLPISRLRPAAADPVVLPTAPPGAGPRGDRARHHHGGRRDGFRLRGLGATGAEHRRVREEPVPAPRDGPGERRDAASLPGPCREVHAQNEGRVNAGVLAAYQLQDSWLGVLQAQKNLLDAKRAEKDAADQLRTTLHLPAGMAIATTPPPPPETAEVSESDALRTAMLRRPDIVKARVAVRTAEFNEKVSRNLALPSLALQGSGGITGLDSDYGDAFGDMSSAKYPNWSIGLSFSVPIGNNARPRRRRGEPADRKPGADPARGDRGVGGPRGPDRPARPGLGA